MADQKEGKSLADKIAKAAKQVEAAKASKEVKVKEDNKPEPSTEEQKAGKAKKHPDKIVTITFVDGRVGTHFEGKWTGRDVSIASRHLVRGYKIHQSELRRKSRG